MIRHEIEYTVPVFCVTDDAVWFLYLQPWSKRLGTLQEIRHKDALC